MHTRLQILLFCGFLFLLSTSADVVRANDDLTVLSHGSDKLLYELLLKQSNERYAKRRQAIEAALRSPETARERGERLLRDYRRIVGELPQQKTPLNAEVMGLIDFVGYRVEKVVFESRPNHHVTATLYIPTRRSGPFPGVVMACGHAASGKGYGLYQKACALLALNGFAVLNYDPISQGERHQILNAPRHGTTTHCLLNTGSVLVGRSIVGYELWDGIRSIDYLLSRDEVDKSKPVGMTGNSGGGTQTTFLMAFDNRIGPAAPSCYTMGKQRKYETIGPADGCQHLPNEVALGIDIIDYTWMRAPKPTLILAAKKDFFEIASTRSAAVEAKRLYTLLGKSEQTELLSYDGEHSFAKPLREGATSWMKRWIMNDTSPVVEPELNILDEIEIRVSRTGQVVSSYPKEVTVAELNLTRARQLAEQRHNFWKDNDTQTCLAEVKRLIQVSEKREQARVDEVGVLQREGYRIDKLVIEREGEIPMPALLFIPIGDASSKRQATVYADSRGKAHEAVTGGEIEKLLQTGQMVLSVDLRGFGETADQGSRKKFYNREHRVSNVSMHLGRPLLGQRVEDLLTAVDVLSARDDVEQIHVVGSHDAGPVAIHATAIDERIASLTIRQSITSWVDDIVANPLAPHLLGHVVPNALLKYDLPDLLTTISPRQVTLQKRP